MKKYVFESTTEYYDNEYHTTTKIYNTEVWQNEPVMQAYRNSGESHWADPSIIYSATIDGTDMSDKCNEIINLLDADEYEEEAE